MGERLASLRARDERGGVDRVVCDARILRRKRPRDGSAPSVDRRIEPVASFEAREYDALAFAGRFASRLLRANRNDVAAPDVGSGIHAAPTGTRPRARDVQSEDERAVLVRLDVAHNGKRLLVRHFLFGRGGHERRIGNAE